MSPPRVIDVSDLDDEDPSESEDLEEEEEPEEPEPVAAPQPAVGMGAIPKRPGASPKKKPARRSNQAPRAPREWDYAEVELLWPELLSCIGRPGHELQNDNVGNVEIRVSRIEPPPAMVVGRFEASLCSGDQSKNPGDAILDAIDDYCHLPTCQPYTNARYDILFVWKAGPKAGKVIARGRAMRPAPSVIVEQRKAMSSRVGMGAAQQSGYFAPHSQPVVGSYPPQPMMGYYPAQQQQPQQSLGMDPYTKHLVDQLVAQNNEMRRELAEMRGQPAPPPIAAPGPQTSEDSIVDKVVNRLSPMISKAVGLGNAQPGSLQAMAGQFLDHMTKKTFAQMTASFDSALSGVAAEPAEKPEVAEPEAPKDPTDDLPFDLIELKTTWPDGSKVHFAKSREKDGPSIMGMHPLGAMLGNPFFINKVTEAAAAGASRVANALGGAAERMVGVGQAPQQQLPQAPAANAPVIDTTATPTPEQQANGRGWPQV